MKRVLANCIVIAFLCGVMPRVVFAEYVLPYPSFMPGNTLYRVTRMIDRLKKPLYFGSISRYKYHLALADKYLVEAKTLFEYKQYLLAADALKRSDREFAAVVPTIARGKKEGKDMRLFAQTLNDASDTHIMILRNLKMILPSEFEWRPEKASATTLTIADSIDVSMMLRESARL